MTQLPKWFPTAGEALNYLINTGHELNRTEGYWEYPYTTKAIYIRQYTGVLYRGGYYLENINT